MIVLLCNLGALQYLTADLFTPPQVRHTDDVLAGRTFDVMSDI